MGAGTAEPLIEREEELATIDAAMASAVSGDGQLLLLKGPPGIGKTSLLEASRRLAGQHALTMLTARGAPMEVGYPYSVVRQLFEPTIAAADDTRRARLLSGAAELATPAVLGPAGSAPDPADQVFAVVHGLYWLLANLEAEGPLALLVDDAHWADRPSLRFLAYLGRRLEGLRLAIIVAIRTADPQAESRLLDELDSAPQRQLARPAPLSEGGVAQLLSTQFGQAPDAAFVQTCAQVTGGNPLFVLELARSLATDGVQPVADAAQRIADVGPRTIAHATLARLGRLSGAAVELARAVAVLDRDARLPRATRLAGIAESEAVDALDTLIGAEVIVSQDRCEFRHPIVRAAIYEELTPGARSIAHRRAAALLAAEGVDLDVVARHLVAAQPMGSPETIATLRQAAAHALTLGAPDSAAAYLDRALEEGCDRELRATLLLELGRAELYSARSFPTERFQEAERLATDAETRAAALIEWARLISYGNDPGPAVDLLDRALAEVTGAPEARRLPIEALRASLATDDPQLIDSVRSRVPLFRELALSGRPGTRPLAMLMAWWTSQHNETAAAVERFVDLGWDEGGYLDEGNPPDLLAIGISALIAVDRLDRATAMVGRLRSQARASGSVMQNVMADAAEAYIETRKGNLVDAAAALHSVAAGVVGTVVGVAGAYVLWYGTDVLLEREDGADLVDLVKTADPGPMAGSLGGALLLETRGRVRFAAGDREGAVADLRQAVAVQEALGYIHCAGGSCPRSALALMLGPGDEAVALAAAELEDARASGVASRIGVAQRSLGLLHAGDEGEARLAEAVTTLADSPARLELARALVALGSAHRRGGNRTTARTTLRDGLDLATRCGATRLAERARTELEASGARLRRDRTAGVDSLTPSELRVAKFAALGQSSRDIAQALFVTPRTVETHLSRVYSKLGINSRRDLADALARDGG